MSNDPAPWKPFPAKPDPAAWPTVLAFDELPLWSSMSGLLLLRHLPLRRGIRVLDVGCGTGFPLIELAERLGPSSSVVGLDPWAHALRRTRLKIRTRDVVNATVRKGDAAKMPFRRGTFDLIVSSLGLNNFADQAAALAECRRVAKPDAVLALTTNMRGTMHEFYVVFEAVLRDLGLSDAVAALTKHVDGRATVESVGARLAATGFKIARVVEDTQAIRFGDGAALFRHWFIRLGFLEAWRDIAGAEHERDVFERLERALGEVVDAKGVLHLTIPLAYFEATPV